LRAGILGRAGVEKLQKFGKLEVVRTDLGLPARVRENARSIKAPYSRDGRIVGAYHNGKIWLVADAMLPGDADFVLRHEGLHMVLEESQSFKRDKAGLLDQFEALAETTSPAARAAFAFY